MLFVNDIVLIDETWDKEHARLEANSEIWSVQAKCDQNKIFGEQS